PSPAAAGPPAAPPEAYDNPSRVFGLTDRLPGPPACAPYEDANGPLLKGSPLLDWPGWAPPGWFAALELDVVGPQLKTRLMASVAATGRRDQVHPPTAELGWTVAPHVELGYRLARGAGELLPSYRRVSAAGSGAIPGFDPDGNTGLLRSH